MPPATLDELLEAIPGLRRQRSLNADWLRTLLSREPKACTWCGDAVPKGRSKWCSDECVAAFKSRCCPQTTRRLVEERDAGICRLCGRDTIAAEAEYGRRLKAMKDTGQLPYGWRDQQAAVAPLYAELGYARGQWREVDHDPPVVLGGGLCDISCLRLLCGACHAEATKRLAGRKTKS